MNLIINSKLIQLIWWLAGPLLSAQLLISFFVLFIDNKDYDPLDVKENEITHIYTFPKLLNSSYSYKHTSLKKPEKFVNIILKASYIENGKKFIIIQDNKKIAFLDLKETYKGAKLIEINLNSAVFLKNEKRIYLSLETDKKLDAKKQRNNINTNSSDNKYINVHKEDFNKYLRDAKQALRDIRVNELIKNSTFLGLELKFVRKNSFFDKIGLKKGDIIKSIDNNNITSIIGLLPYYDNLKNISTLQIKLERDGIMKEIIYEIN